MAGGLITLGIGAAGFGAGALVVLLMGAFTRRRPSQRKGAGEDVPGETHRVVAHADAPGSIAQGPAPSTPQLSGVIAQAIREPLRQLRRAEGCPPAALRQLERIAWQTRMLGAGLRPMQSKPVSPISLLQAAAEDVPLLRDGVVSASWSLLNRRPIQVDPERARVAFREIMAASAESCGEGGRLAIRILAAGENGSGTQIEVESGRPGCEADPLAFLVARRLLETQGGQVELDGRVTRVHLRGSGLGAAGPAQTPSKR